MRYQILKQFIAVDNTDPWWASRNTWVQRLPVGNDTLDIYQTYERAEEAIEHKIELQNELDELGNDQVDKFGRTIKDRIYKIIEIE